MTEYLYRYEDVQYASYDPFSDHSGPGELRVRLRKFPIERRTRKGAWVCGRFVLLSARKRYACPTQDEAMESFIARKKRQLSIHQYAVARAQTALRIAQREPLYEHLLDDKP